MPDKKNGHSAAWYLGVIGTLQLIFGLAIALAIWVAPTPLYLIPTFLAANGAIFDVLSAAILLSEPWD